MPRTARKMIMPMKFKLPREERRKLKEVREVNGLVGELVSYLGGPVQNRILSRLRKKLPRSIRVHVLEDENKALRIKVFHDCEFDKLPIALRFASSYAEKQLDGGKAVITKPSTDKRQRNSTEP